MIPNVEILVHVSGSSRGIDDARYRKEAKAFLDFEPAETHYLLPSGTSDRDSHGKPRASTRNRDEDVTTPKLDGGQGEPPLPPFIPSPKRGSLQRFSTLRDGIVTENDIYQNGTDASLGPTSRAAGTIQRDTGLPTNVSTSAVRTPFAPKAVGIDLQRTSVKETPHLQIKQTPVFQRPRTAPTATTPAQAPPQLRRTQSDSWQTPPSTIPDSQPKNAPSYPLPIIQSSPCFKRAYQSSSPSPTHDSPLDPKRPRLQVSSSPPLEEPLIDSSPPHLPPPSTSSALTHVSGSPCASPSNTTCLEIHPPRPDASISRFETHVTPQFIMLTDKSPLSKIFHPYILCQSRKLDKLERGYWHIPLSSWSASDVLFLWDFLSHWVPNGECGFGTRCFLYLSKDHGFQDGEANTSGAEDTIMGRAQLLKVYCWGETVGEIWVLLFVGSKRRVSGRGAQWIDAGGKVVLEMR